MLKLIKRNGRKIAASVMAAGLALANASYFQTVDFSNVYVSAATGEYLTWKQSDPRWGSVRLGGSCETIRQSGCAVTSIAMLLVKSGNFDESTINPGSLCEFLSKNGGLDNNACIYWGKVSEFCPSFTFEGTGMLYGTTAEEKAAEYKSYLDQGYYLVADVRYSGHWVAIDRVEGGVVYMMDPAAGTSNVLFDQYDFRGCTRVKLFRSSDQPIKPAEPAADQTVTYETGSYVTTDSLRVRSGATTASDTLDILDRNTSLKVEDVSGCWGKVSINGVVGWVCLTYTEKTEDVPEVSVPDEAPVEVTAETVGFETGEYITNDVINYRTEPTTAADSFGLIQNGVSLQVTEISSNWGKTSYNGKDCWICLDYADRTGDLSSVEAEVSEKTDELIPMYAEIPVTEAVQTEVQAPEEETVSEEQTTEAEEEVSEPEAAEEETAVVEETVEEEVSAPVTESAPYITIDYLNFRAERGVAPSNPPLFTISPYEIVMVEETADNWGKINYNGQTGWICLSYAEAVAENTDTVSESISEETETAAEVTEDVQTDEAAVPEQNSEEVQSDENAESVMIQEEAEIMPLKGDINQDGIVSILDIVEMARMILDITDKEIIADINGDGIVSVSDFVALKRIMLGE